MNPAVGMQESLLTNVRVCTELQSQSPNPRPESRAQRLLACIEDGG